MRLGGSTGGAIRLAVLAVAAFVLAACGGAGSNGGAGDGDESPATEEQVSGGGGARGGQDEADQAYERSWKIGDGGEVEVRFENGSLELLDARPNEGWDVAVEEQSADEIGVGFSRGDEGWKFEADAEVGRLEVKTRQELRDAQAGTHRLGDAGAVQLRREGGGITPVQTQSTGGWGVDVAQRDGEEVEVRFERQDERQDERWNLEAEVEDGRLKVETVREVTEPVRG